MCRSEAQLRGLSSDAKALKTFTHKGILDLKLILMAAKLSQLLVCTKHYEGYPILIVLFDLHPTL